MSFDYNATGIDADSKGTSKVLPKGWYTLMVVEFVSKAGDTYPKDGRTKNGDPMVNILCEVSDEGEYHGEWVFHTVTFLKKDSPGAGMSVHFLKTIGQPYEGQFKVDSSQWVGSEFMGYVIQEEYKGKIKNKIGEIKTMEGGFKNPEIAQAAKTDSVPF